MASDSAQTLTTETLNPEALSPEGLNPGVIVTGASSQIGIFAIPRLLAAGFSVLAVSRQARPAGFPESDQLTWCTLQEALQSHTHCQYLLSAGPMKLALKVLQRVAGIERAVIFSSTSVIAKLDSADAAERQLMQQMLDSESRLQALAMQHDIQMTIFRPTLIYGCGLDGNVSRLAAFIRRFSMLPVNGKAEGLRQPVHADDLASVAIAALQTQVELPAYMSLAGGSTISYRQMLEALFLALNKPVRIVAVPKWILIPAVKLMAALGITAGVSAAMIKRQRQNLQFDDQPARQLLGYQPRPFSPAASDFRLPDTNAQAPD